MAATICRAACLRVLRLLTLVPSMRRVVGALPDGHSALMLVAARLRHVSATTWGMRKYMNMKLLDEMEQDQTILENHKDFELADVE